MSLARPPGDEDDDDRTVIPAAAAPQGLPGHTLAPGTRLLDYEVAGLIGEGGFGIVYLAWDHSLQRQVAIKEYMPAAMASRAAGSSAIVVKSDRHVDTFKAGLKSFVNEARLLARFDHPALVKVYRFWEENGTAYMVMPFYEGPTLKAALADLGHLPSEDEIRAWLRPLLDALAVLHASHCYHRDIAPDNILLTRRGPLLLDFGAARRVIGDMTHALTVVLKPGYAPIEQYGEVATMAQGAWTDFYALASVAYFAITGRTPTSSVERLMDDRLEPLATLAAGRYSDAFLRAIDAALAVRPQDRPQTDAAFRALLNVGRSDADLAADSRPGGLGPASGWAPFPTTRSEPMTTVPRPPPFEIATPLLAGPPTIVPAEAMPAAGAPAAAAAPGAPPLRPNAHRTTATATTAAPAPSRGAPRRGLLVAAVLAFAALISAAAWFSTSSRDEAVPASQPAAPAAEPFRAGPAPMETPQTAAPPPALVTPPQTGEGPRTETAAPAAVATPAVADTDPRPAARPKPAPSPRPQAPEVVAPPKRAAGARCSDILQKASLEPLTADEAAYLRRECR